MVTSVNRPSAITLKIESLASLIGSGAAGATQVDKQWLSNRAMYG